MGRLYSFFSLRYAADIKLPTVPEWSEPKVDQARMQHYLACRGFTTLAVPSEAVLALMRKTHLVITDTPNQADWLMSIISKHPRTPTPQEGHEGEGVVDLREASCNVGGIARRKRRRAPYRFYPNSTKQVVGEGCSVKHAQMILGRAISEVRYQIGKVLEIACLVTNMRRPVNKNGNLPEYVDISRHGFKRRETVMSEMILDSLFLITVANIAEQRKVVHDFMAAVVAGF
ncbi:hypothetical protein SPFM8_00183 [Salmonella phage SPFM8]|nr:hypothetical protein SPFM8_00183 [Salmonella phage SPFM8]